MAEYNLGTARGRVEIDSSDIQGASKELKNADIVLRQTGTSLINFGQQVVGAFAYVVGIGAKFEKEMDFIQAVTGATAEEMEALKQKSIELGKQGPFGPNALADSFIELAKAGISVQDIVDGVGKAVVDLAGAAQITAQQAGDIVVQLKNIFQLAATEVPHAVDIIAGAANASSIDVQDFATTLKYVGPVAQSMGISLEDLATTIAVLGNSGIKGSQAGTTLRQTIVGLSGSTTKAKKALKELGIITEDGSNKFYDANGQVKNLAEVFDVLRQATANLGDQEKQQVLKDIFGVRQLPTVLYLLDQGMDKFSAMNDQINQTTAADVAAKRLDNLQGSVQKFKASLEAVLLGPSSPFQDMLKGIVDFATRMVTAFGNLPPGLQQFIIGAIGAIGALSILAGGFLLTIGNIVRMIRVMSELSGLLTKLPALFSAFTTGAEGAGIASLLNPLGLFLLLIAAIALAVYLLITRWDEFKAGLGVIKAKLEEFGGAIYDFVHNQWADFLAGWDRLKQIASDVWNSFVDTIGGAISAVVGFFEELPGAIGRAISSFIGTIVDKLGGVAETVIGFFESLPEKVGEIASRMTKAFTDELAKLPHQIGYIIGFAIGYLIRSVFEFGKAAYNIGKTIVSGIYNELIALPGQIASIFTTVINFLTGVLTQLGSLAVDMGTAIYNGIVDFIKGIPGFFKAVFDAILTFFTSLIPQFASAAWNIGFSVFHSIVDFIAAIPGQVWGFMLSAFNAIAGWLGNFIQTAKDIGSNIYNGIVDGIKALPGVVADIASKVYHAFLDLVKDAFNAAKDFAKGLWDGFKDGLGMHSPSYIEEALFTIQDTMADTEAQLKASIGRMGLTSKPLIAGVTGGTTAQLAGAAGASGFVVNGPLLAVDTLTGTQEEALSISRRLADESYRQLAAQGQRVVLKGTQ
jgi:TP901 family phage tail tape measure protein